jgi:sugar lactone lactonase YvrE
LNAAVECVVDSRDQLGESVLWCSRSERVWWVDVLRAVLHELWWPAGVHRTHQLPFRRLGSIGLRACGGLVLATEQGLFGWDADRGVGARLMAPRWNVETHRLNDGRCDRSGRFWVGSMHDTQFIPEGQLFSIGPGSNVTAHFGDIIVPNAIAFSPDDCRFYFADTRRYVLWQFDFDIAAGHLGNRRPLIEFGSGPARPDGACVDANGCIWNASYQGASVVRYTPNGVVDTVVPLPVSCPTCVCLGGRDLDTLFVTSASYALPADRAPREPLAGGLFALRVTTAGLMEPMFAS